MQLDFSQLHTLLSDQLCDEHSLYHENRGISVMIPGANSTDAASKTFARSMEVLIALTDCCAGERAACRLYAIHHEAYLARRGNMKARIHHLHLRDHLRSSDLAEAR